jgi:addiction module RelE/StbE family toxin
VKILWTWQAETDRADIFTYISEDNVHAAIAMDELIASSAGRLADHPMIGKPGRIEGTREWVVHESYRMHYELLPDEGTALILAIVHTAQRWPPKR